MPANEHIVGKILKILKEIRGESDRCCSKELACGIGFDSLKVSVMFPILSDSLSLTYMIKLCSHFYSS